MKFFRFRSPSLKTLLGITKAKRRAQKALGINAILAPFRAWGNAKRRVKRSVGYYSTPAKIARNGLPSFLGIPALGCGGVLSLGFLFVFIGLFSSIVTPQSSSLTVRPVHSASKRHINFKKSQSISRHAPKQVESSAGLSHRRQRTKVEWLESDTHRIKIKRVNGRVVGRWSFKKKTSSNDTEADQQNVRQITIPTTAIGKLLVPPLSDDWIELYGVPETLPGTTSLVLVAFFRGGNFTVVTNRLNKKIVSVLCGRKPLR